MKIIFLTDFLMHSPFIKGTYHNWLIKIINSAQKLATDADIIEFKDYKKNDAYFDRNYFYTLSRIENIDEQYYLYDMSKINEESWKYFFDFIGEDVFIIGFELGLDLRKKLTEKGINYINFWIHSFKLFDDIAFLINTNNENIFKELQNYKIPKLKFQVYTDYWKANIVENTRFIEPQYDSILEDNSVLFIGQTFKDKSVQKGNKFLNILDFKDKLAELSKEYKKIYYSPHPYVFNAEEVDKYINSVDYVEKIDKIPTYYLLASEKIKKVISISSSVVYEAQYFGKKTEYLYQPLFDIDGEFGLNTFISVIDDYYNPKFWSKILSPVMRTNSNIPDKILIENTKNKLRNVVRYYWGFSYLDDIKKLETKIQTQLIELQNQQTNIQNQQIELQNQQIGLNENVASGFVELNKRIEKIEEKQPRIYKRIKKDNKVVSYLLGIPIYKRKNSKFYILGIPVWNKDWNNKFFSVKNADTPFYKYINILGWSKRIKNYNVDSGERQIATNLDDIRKDHIYRYSTAIEYIKKYCNNEKSKGLDIFCGNGYGSYMITSNLENTNLLSFDGCKGAIKLANNYYKTDRNTYKHKLFPFKLKKNYYDYVVSLESIEHINKDTLFLKTISNSLKKDGLLVISTPNKNKYSLDINENHFHYRHYSTEEFVKLLEKYNFEVKNLYGQDTYSIDETGKVTGMLSNNEMILRENYDGQFTIYVAIKK